MELTDKLQELGLKALNFAEMTANQLYSFIEKEAPLLLQEWINWNFWSSLILFTLAIIMIITVIIYLISTTKPITITYISYGEEKTRTFNSKWAYWDRDGHDMFGAVMVTLFGGIGIIGGSIGIIIENTAWLQILIAPRVWILQNIKDLF